MTTLNSIQVSESSAWKITIDGDMFGQVLKVEDDCYYAIAEDLDFTYEIFESRDEAIRFIEAQYDAFHDGTEGDLFE